MPGVPLGQKAMPSVGPSKTIFARSRFGSLRDTVSTRGRSGCLATAALISSSPSHHVSPTLMTWSEYCRPFSSASPPGWSMPGVPLGQNAMPSVGPSNVMVSCVFVGSPGGGPLGFGGGGGGASTSGASLASSAFFAAAGGAACFRGACRFSCSAVYAR